MTKKDYELIADILKGGRKLPIETRDTDKGEIKDHIDILAEHFADVLYDKNPLFKREKFLKACEVEV